MYYADPSGYSCDKDATQRQPEGSGSFADQLAQHVADEIAFNQEHGLTTQYDTPQVEAANRRVEQELQVDNYANRPNGPSADVPNDHNRTNNVISNQSIAAECNQRATEINNARGDWESRNGTTVVAKAIDNRTNREVYLVATNAPNETVPKSLQGVLNDNEVYIGGRGHAEETIMNNIGDRYTIIAGGTSRNICKDICAPLLEADGLTLGGSTYRGRNDKTPYRQFWRDDETDN